jgi:hypothetical protein
MKTIFKPLFFSGFFFGQKLAVFLSKDAVVRKSPVIGWNAGDTTWSLC